MKTYTEKYDSVWALGQHVESDTDYMSRSCHDSASDSMACNMSPAEALKRARDGGRYPEGAKDIKPLEIDASALNISDLAVKQPVLDRVGYRVSVPHLLRGQPKNMYRQLPQPMPNRLIKIGVHVGKPFTMEQSETLNRGNAILSVCDALEQLGLEIELWAIWRNAEDQSCVSIETLIKKPDERYDPESIAFSICNDAMQRRLCWRAGEMATAHNKHAREVMHGGYGSDRGVSYADFDLSYPRPSERRYWGTKKNALEHVLEITKEQLKELRERAA